MDSELLNKQEVKIRGMFSRIAPWYDFLNHFLSLNIDQSWRKKTTKIVAPDLSRQEPILDLCTGTGDLALAYAKLVNGQVPVIGADFCHEMLAIAGKKSVRKRHQGVAWVEADAQQLPFPDGQFQIVSVAFGLRNVTRTEVGLAEMARVAAPGGRVAVLEFSKPRGRIFGPIYRWYFRSVLPKLGQLFSRSPDSAYRYLPESVMAFPDYEALTALMEQAGLTEVRYYPFTFGICTLYVGRKPN